MKAENPKSNVIPRSLLCGCLSNAAVEATLLIARAIPISQGFPYSAPKEVFPLSICPNKPTLTLNTLLLPPALPGPPPSMAAMCFNLKGSHNFETFHKNRSGFEFIYTEIIGMSEVSTVKPVLEAPFSCLPWLPQQ